MGMVAEAQAATQNSTLGTAARGINRDLLKTYRGDAKAAEKAVAEVLETPEIMEAWATGMLRAQAERAMNEQHELLKLIVEQNQKRGEEKRVKHLDNEWLSDWLRLERQAAGQIQPFKVSELPGSIRDSGLRGLAIAFLVHAYEQEATA